MYSSWNNAAFGNKPQRTYKSLQEALVLISEAIRDENEDAQFYSYLASVAPAQEAADILIGIRDDELRHLQMFQDIYYCFTGRQVSPEDMNTAIEPICFYDGLKQAFFNEISAIESYRDILAGLPYIYYRDMVFEILTDELIHADKINYIFNIYPMK